MAACMRRAVFLRHAYEGAGGTDIAHVSAGERGVAVTPYGAAAGGRYAARRP